MATNGEKITIKNPLDGADIVDFHIGTDTVSADVTLLVGQSVSVGYEVGKILTDTYGFLRLDEGVDIEAELEKDKVLEAESKVISGSGSEEVTTAPEGKVVEVKLDPVTVPTPKSKEDGEGLDDEYEEIVEFECGVCQKLFNNKKSLTGHMLSHRPKK